MNHCHTFLKFGYSIAHVWTNPHGWSWLGKPFGEPDSSKRVTELEVQILSQLSQNMQLLLQEMAEAQDFFILMVKLNNHWSGVGKCPSLGILNITFKYLLEIISPIVGWCSIGTFTNPCWCSPAADPQQGTRAEACANRELRPTCEEGSNWCAKQLLVSKNGGFVKWGYPRDINRLSLFHGVILI